MPKLDDILDKIAENIKKWDLTVSDFISRADVSEDTYRNAVIRRKTDPFLGNLQKMAYAVGWTLTLDDKELDFKETSVMLWGAYNDQKWTYKKLAAVCGVNRESCRKIMNNGGINAYLDVFIKVVGALGFEVKFKRKEYK